VLASLAGSVAIVLGLAAPASAATILLITPSSVAPGFIVTISATCGDNANPAFVNSDVFGSITLVPDNGKLHTNVTVPSDTRPATYTVTLTCASGQVTTSKLTVLSHAPLVTPNPNVGPATGGGELGASTAARLAIVAGIVAVIAGVVFFIVSVRRRRSTLPY
jgi:hypothetical protein